MADKADSGSIATENLKTVRLLHQILMVVSAAILAFALRPDHEQAYKDALTELSNLREVSFQEWPRFILDHFKKDEDYNVTFVKDAIRRSGIPAKGDLDPTQPVYGELPPLFGLLKLADYDAFFNSSKHIGSFRITSNKKDITTAIKNAMPSNDHAPMITSAWISVGGSALNPTLGNVSMMDSRNLPSVRVGTLQLGVYDTLTKAPATTVSVDFTYANDIEARQFPLEWIRSDTSGRALVGDKTGKVFPHLKQFWDKVNRLGIDDAAVFLETQSESDKRGTIEFFGIPVETNLVVLAGPCVCFLILIFLVLHERHIHQISIDHEILRTYPWVPLFRGAWGFLVALASILVLPILANVCLLIKFGQWQEPENRAGWAFCVLMIPFAIWSIIELRRLRQIWPRG